MLEHGQNYEALSFCDVSVVVTQFIRELFFALILSLSCYDLCVFPVNTTLALHGVPCQASIFFAHPFFGRQSVSFLKVFICQSDFVHVFFLSCLEKVPCFSYICSILAGTRKLIHNTFLPFTKWLLTCAFNLFNLSLMETNPKLLL